ncbi:pentatricopeptide repeat-containing protein At2g21090-like [Impatiens glandulifera]|uniref:pentatricopeptide repeat-containing protein At2g21090-like n=1 Tax=Impatiens glandulifera TaxID=253017 RepID=UPI001FB07761|nr:pentatricopeptide repeat-containing protein At2g21090-like [Impatiens glandulifera]
MAMQLRAIGPPPPLPPPPIAGDSNPAAVSLSFQETGRRPSFASLTLSANYQTHNLNSSTYASILDPCEDASFGRQVHAHAIKMGFLGDQEFVETKLLQMYERCGCFQDALLLFDKMPTRNLYSWTAILNAYVAYGFYQEAFYLYQDLMFEVEVLDFFVFPVVLKMCGGIGNVQIGMQVHGLVIKHGFISNTYVSNAMIDAYGKCGRPDFAKRVFSSMKKRDRVTWNSIITSTASNGMVFEALEFIEKMSLDGKLEPNLVTWSALISGFSRNGYDREAIEMLSRGFEPNAQTLASVLPACARLGDLKLGKEIHGYVSRHGFMSNSIIVNGLLDVYRRCGDMDSAMKIFRKYSLMKNTVSFNTMLVGYFENGAISEAEKLFDELKRGGGGGDDIISSWNTMISGYVDNSMFDAAIDMFIEVLMKDRVWADTFTFGSVLTACAESCSLRLGMQVHAMAIVRGLHVNIFVGEALIDMYCKCRDIEAARNAFEGVLERDLTTWNILISGFAYCNLIHDIDNALLRMKEEGLNPNIYTMNGIMAGLVENGNFHSAMELFSGMQGFELKPDVYSVGIMLPACSKLASVERGKQIHAYSIRFGLESDVHIGSAIVDMYAKCGKLDHALASYNRISNPNLVAQNTMLSAYAIYGYWNEGINFFNKMLENHVIPDSVTFVSVLSLCINAGEVETGKELYDLMRSYNVEPTLKHLTCMVDLLSRVGRVKEAYRLVKEMSMEPDAVTWGALLGGCVLFGEVEIGEVAAEKLISLEPDNSGNYVMLANLYVAAERWDDVAKTRQLIKEKEMQKNRSGCSWIEDRNEINVFIACDTSHKRTQEMYSILDTLTIHMRHAFSP